MRSRWSPLRVLLTVVLAIGMIGVAGFTAGNGVNDCADCLELPITLAAGFSEEDEEII